MSTDSEGDEHLRELERNAAQESPAILQYIRELARRGLVPMIPVPAPPTPPPQMIPGSPGPPGLPGTQIRADFGLSESRTTDPLGVETTWLHINEPQIFELISTEITQRPGGKLAQAIVALVGQRIRDGYLKELEKQKAKT